ncbi:MAG: low molecular weight protein arginine phosphatase [candidate division WOR-3 bacterium]|nr:low molecular weight protein arginine phosphatase [candidate division WOR-3 bacterium]
MIRKKLKTKIHQPDSWTILFVCTGNSCRSPMAKGIFDKLLEKSRAIKKSEINILTLSAGTNATKGNVPSEFAQQAVKKYGVDIRHHLSYPLTKERIDLADLILVMENKHKDRVLELVPLAKNRTFLITEYVGEESKEIPDPFGGPLEKFQEVADLLYELLQKVYKIVIPKIILH